MKLTLTEECNIQFCVQFLAVKYLQNYYSHLTNVIPWSTVLLERLTVHHVV